MSWVRLDENASEHRKLVAAGGEAAWLWACGLMFCNRQNDHDGFIPDAQVTRLYAGYSTTKARKLAEKLAEVSLWHRVDGGYQIHDYHDYQPDQSTVASLRETRRAAGAAGGRASGEARRAKQSEANAKQLASPNPKHFASSKTNPVPARTGERSTNARTLVQDWKSAPGTTGVRAEVIEISEETERAERLRAEAQARLAALSEDPSFAAGGRR